MKEETENWQDLIQKHLDGLTSESEAAALSDQIVNDAEIRREYLKAARIHGALDDESLAVDLDTIPFPAPAPAKRGGLRPFAWSKQLAAAIVAGAFVGILGVGVAWAVGTPRSEASLIPISNGDFERLSGPVENGIPSHFGEWGGNPAEVIEEVSGNRILRLLKTGNVKGGPDDIASNCSVFQLVDLSSLRQQWETADPEAQVTINLSARFRRDAAVSDAEFPKSKVSCRVYLFNVEPNAIGREWPRVISENGIGHGKKEIKLEPGEEPQTITASCLLESDATVALIAVAASTSNRGAPVDLGGYFVDDVQLTVIRHPHLPVRFIK